MSIKRSDYRAFLKQVEVALETALDEQEVQPEPYRDQLEAMHGEVVRTRRALDVKIDCSGNNLPAE